MVSAQAAIRPLRPAAVGVLATLGTLTSEAAIGTKRAGIGSGVLAWFAVSCPACNKIVVALLGASGATGTFAPLQPALGAVAVALATGALVVRVRALRRAACPVPDDRAPGSARG
jgi:hypothetical protein